MADELKSGTWRRLRILFGRTIPCPCIECGETVSPGDAWDLSHKRARSMGGQVFATSNLGVAHSKCNRAQGYKLRVQAGQGKRGTATPSRQWFTEPAEPEPATRVPPQAPDIEPSRIW